MSKLLIIMLTFLTISALLNAQEYPGGYVPNDEYGKKKSQINNQMIFYAGVKVPVIDNSLKLELGSGLGVLINKQYGVAFEYYSLLSSDIMLRKNTDEDNILRLNYGGFEFSYSYFPINIVKLSVGIMAGLARATNTNTALVAVQNYAPDDWFYLFEPRVRIDVRLFSKFWLDAGAGYRVPSGLKFYDYVNKDLTGMYFNIGILIF